MANGRARSNPSPYGGGGRPWIWHLVIVALLVTVVILLFVVLVKQSSIRADSLPHCFRIFGTGPDVRPGPGEAPPFSGSMQGPLLKGELEVGDCCLRWQLFHFDLTSQPTDLRLHGPRLGNATTAPTFVEMGAAEGSGTTGTLVRKRCLEITYEQEEAIVSRPQLFYLQLYNEAFPNGALRSPLGTRCGGSL